MKLPEKSLIIACDLDLEESTRLIQKTYGIKGVGGYKIPARSGRKGWEAWVESARKYTSKPLIYDHQKAGGDVPHISKGFLKDVKDSGFAAMILFPLAGPVSQHAWIETAMEYGLEIIAGGSMTMEKFRRSEGGYICDDAFEKIYVQAAKQGVRNFVLPAGGEDLKFDYLIRKECENPVLFSPGIKDEKEIIMASKILKSEWHPIIGRAIYNSNAIASAERFAKIISDHFQ